MDAKRIKGLLRQVLRAEEGWWEVKQCCAKAHDSYGVGFHPCSRRSRVERDGKPYCLQHDPVVRKAKSDERTKAWRAKWDASDKRAKQVDAALNTISTLNALGYDGEQCIRELPEMVAFCVNARAFFGDKPADSDDTPYANCVRALIEQLESILAKCKAKG